MSSVRAQNNRRTTCRLAALALATALASPALASPSVTTAAQEEACVAELTSEERLADTVVLDHSDLWVDWDS